MNRIGIYTCLWILLLLGGCTGLRHVPTDEILYTGAKVEIVTEAKIKKTGRVKSDVEAVIKPEPNKKFLWMRPGLWLYYATGTPKKEKGLRGWLKYKIAQPPVYMSNVDVPLISKGIDAKLYNTGFLDSYNEYEIIQKQHKKAKTASLVFKVHLKEPYTIREITFPKDSSALSMAIARTAKRTLIKKGGRYSLETLLDERVRIDNYLKRRGYYYFNPDYILYEMDTSTGSRTVRLRTTIKRDIPYKARLVYHIAEVNIYPDYTLSDDTVTTQRLVIDSINYYRGSNYIRPAPVVNNVFFKPNTIYNKRIHEITLSRLNSLGVFKFINVNINDKDTAAPGLLAVNIFLTPLPKKMLSLELQVATKSNNFIGPGLMVGHRNRNTFKGAELLIYNISGAFEAQYSGQFKGFFNYEINPRVELQIPKFIGPYRANRRNMYVPRIKFSIDYAYLSRVGYFDMNSLKFGMGYKWKQRLEIDHDLTLININYYNIYHTSAKFEELLRDNFLLRRRFEEQFLVGSAYSFFYNEQVKKHKRNQVYFNGNVEVAGNTLALVSRIITGKPVSSSNPAQVLGVNFAQLARFDVDVRDYYRTTTNTTMAFRIIAGWGIPYGNSLTLPYSRQFFAGGAYSVRGFTANSLGPGSYAPPDSVRNVFYLQQGGEIKLEANAEFRFPIIRFFKGAVFVDAGNTWLNRPNADAPGGELKWKNVLKELAFSAGAGLRLDLDFFVLRLDIGVPIRNPGVPESQRWVIERTKFSSLVFNLAFGYPF